MVSRYGSCLLAVVTATGPALTGLHVGHPLIVGDRLIADHRHGWLFRARCRRDGLQMANGIRTQRRQIDSQGGVNETKSVGRRGGFQNEKVIKRGDKIGTRSNKPRSV